MSIEQRAWFEEVAIKSLLVFTSLCFSLETVSLAQVPDPIAVGRQTETLGIVGILAALIVILVAALVMVYRGKEDAALRRERRLEELIGQVSAVVATNTEATHAETALMVEVRTTLAHCHSKNGRPL